MNPYYYQHLQDMAQRNIGVALMVLLAAVTVGAYFLAARLGKVVQYIAVGLMLMTWLLLFVQGIITEGLPQ